MLICSFVCKDKSKHNPTWKTYLMGKIIWNITIILNTTLRLYELFSVIPKKGEHGVFVGYMLPSFFLKEMLT